MEDDHGDAAGPSTYVRGYHRLPQEDIDMLSTSNWGDQTTSQNQQPPPVPLPPYSPVPGYAPAPQTFRTPQQTSSSSSNNVVVVDQPSAAQPSTVIVERVRPRDNLICLLCLMVVCFLIGNHVAFVCLIPALILSLASGCASNSGDYETAATYGKAACCFSLFSVAITLIAVLVAIIFVILIFTTGLAFLGIAKEELA